MCVAGFETAFAKEFADKHLEVTDEVLKMGLVKAKIPEQDHDELL